MKKFLLNGIAQAQSVCHITVKKTFKNLKEQVSIVSVN